MNTWYKFILNALFSKKREDKDWETTDKVQAYPMCPYYLTSSIAKLDEVGVNSAINRISSKLQTFDHWDEQTIAQRQEMLYKLSLDIWNLNA